MVFFISRARLRLSLLVVGVLFGALVSGVQAAAPPAKKSFDLPIGPAPVSLRQFISQSGIQLLYVAEEVSDVKTNAVKGEFTTGEAMVRLLANTNLIAIETENGAIAINRAAGPNGHRAAQKTARDRPARLTKFAHPKLFPLL